MITLLAYVLCAVIWLVDDGIGEVPWWCWLNWSVAVLCCIARQVGQWHLSRRMLAVLGGLEITMIAIVLIFVGYTHSPLFLVGTMALVEQGHRIGTRWGLACGLAGAAAVAIGKYVTMDPNFNDAQFSFLFYSELAFWPLAGVLQLRLYAPDSLRTNVSRAGGEILALSDMSEANIITLLNNTTNRLYALLDLFRQLETERDMDRLMHSAVKCAKETTASDVGALLVPGKDDQLIVICSVGDGVIAGNNERGDMSVLQEVARTGKPYSYRSEKRSGGVRVPWLDHSVRAYIAVPMVDTLDNKPMGVMVIANTENRNAYEPGTVDFLTLLASQTGVAISNDRMLFRLDRAAKDMVHTLAKVLETKEEDTTGHIMRVVNNSLELARMQGLSRDEIDEIGKAAMLHDVGKIYISDDILWKQGPLSAKEFATMKSHTVKARDILKGCSLVSENVLDMIVHHHERYDGNGYPDQLKGDNINIGASIIAIADAYDGMTSDRPHRKGMEPRRALELMKEGAGTQFHPRLLEQFIERKTEQLDKAEAAAAKSAQTAKV